MAMGGQFIPAKYDQGHWLFLFTAFLFPAYESKLSAPKKENRPSHENRFLIFWVEDGIRTHDPRNHNPLL
jgi:hypothetical protein